MITTIRLRKEGLTEDLINRNKAVIIKETEKTITFEIETGPNQIRLSEKQIKKNWDCWIY